MNDLLNILMFLLSHQQLTIDNVERSKNFILRLIINVGTVRKNVGGVSEEIALSPPSTFTARK